MTVKVSDYDTVKVTYFKTHYGHDNRLEYVPIPEDVKNIIAGQLKEGKKMNRDYLFSNELIINFRHTNTKNPPKHKRKRPL